MIICDILPSWSEGGGWWCGWVCETSKWSMIYILCNYHLISGYEILTHRGLMMPNGIKHLSLVWGYWWLCDWVCETSKWSMIYILCNYYLISVYEILTHRGLMMPNGINHLSLVWGYWWLCDWVCETSKRSMIYILCKYYLISGYEILTHCVW